MPQVIKEQKRYRKPEKQQKVGSSNAAESRIPFSKNPKKKRFMFVKLKGLGCKGTSLTAAPASAPAIIRSAAEWEAKGARKRNQRKKRQAAALHNPENVVVDVPHVCCTPPGIGIASDVAPRPRNPAPRLDHRKHSREGRRNDNNGDAAPEFPAVLSVGIGSRSTHRSAEEIIETLMSRQALLPGRILRRHERYQDWRLDVDDMSYEELLDLGDKIGYVGTGLKEEEISRCVRRFKQFDHHSHRDWKCSICQEKCRMDDDIGMLECGHHHHIHCIKQWLLQRNACPVCKSAANSK